MSRSISWLLLVLSLLLGLVGFAPPHDPRVTAVVVPELGGESIESAAHARLHRKDGVVLVVAIAERQTRIETGPDARRALSDAEAQRILDDRMRPLLREGRTDDAVDAGVAAVEDALNRPAPTSTTHLSPMAWIGCGLGVCGLLLLFASAANAGDRARRRRRGASDAVVHVPTYVDSGSSGGSGGGGASSGW